MKNYNKNNLKIGDTILVEQAWEDEAGNDHDEFAEIIAISPQGELELKFINVSPSVQFHLLNYEYFANDYKKEG